MQKLKYDKNSLSLCEEFINSRSIQGRLINQVNVMEKHP